MKRSILAITLIIYLSLVYVEISASAPIITNGDFSDPVDLAGFVDTGSIISEPTGDFGQMDTDGTFTRTLEQTFTIPSVSTLFSFDFAFSTEASVPFPNLFSDSFAVSMITTVDSDFLHILVVDVNGGVTPGSDVSYDSSVTIPGFTPFSGGTAFSGLVSLWLPNEVLSEEATVFFDLFDQSDSFHTRAAVDNISAEPIPEPGTILLLTTGLAGMAGCSGIRFRRKRKR